MAAKKVGLQMAWTGDQFHLGDLVFDATGARDQQDRVVEFTDTEAAELIEMAAASEVVLVKVNKSDSGTASGGTSTPQE